MNSKLPAREVPCALTEEGKTSPPMSTPTATTGNILKINFMISPGECVAANHALVRYGKSSVRRTTLPIGSRL
jgi:hypothetical protein